MNFSFYIFGVPNNKYDQFHSDYNIELFTEFAQNQNSDVKLIIYRKNQLIYYTYLRSGLLTKARNGGAYLGMSMVFNGVCFHDVKGVFELFNNLYSSLILEEEIIKKYDEGKIAFTINKFFKKLVVIDECKAFLQRNIEDHFSQIGKDYTVLDGTFSQANITVKTLSLNVTNLDIIDAVRKFQYIVLSPQNVIISKPEKFKIKKWVLLFLVIAIIMASIIWVINNNSWQTPVMVKNYEVNMQDGLNYQYSGELKDNIPNGKGKAKYRDSSIYEGDFKNGLRHGKGRMIFPDGYTFTGNFILNKVEGKSDIQFLISGKYICNLEFPKKDRFKIVISFNSVTNEYYGQFINYGYRDTLFASEFIVNLEDSEISNSILGVGAIIKNSRGEIEIISKPENAKKWNMRKIQ